MSTILFSVNKGVSFDAEPETPQKPADKVKGEALTREWFFECLREEQHQENGIFMLPIVLGLLVLFTGMVLGHERSVARQSLRSAIRDDITENANYDYLRQVGFKNLDNVNAPAAVIDWMRLGFFDHLLWKTADEATGELTGEYLQYNRIIGGIRLLTQRMNESVGRCDLGETFANTFASSGAYDSSLAETFDSPCMFETTNDRAAEGYDDLAFPPDGEETTDWSAGPSFEPRAIKPNLVRWFMMSEDRSQQERMLAELLDQNFIDRQTRQVMVSMVLFNADLQLICLVESNFLFARTGRVWPLLRIKTIDPDPFHQPFLLPFDILFLVLMFVNCARDFAIFFKTWHKVGFAHLRPNLPHTLLWYFLDIVGFSCSCALFFFFYEFYDSAKSLVDELQDNYESMISDSETMATFLNNVEETAHTTLKPYRTALLIYPFSLMCRLGLGFSGNERLSMTTRVIAACASDLFHFMLVYMSFMVCFTVLGMLMFGRDVEAFSTMSRSLQSNIQMMFGDVDWETLNAAGFMRALMFHWAFHMVLVLLMFNIIVAILIDTYESLREEMGKHIRPQTLFAQTVQTCQRRRRVWKGEVLKLNHIWMECLREYGHQVMSDDLFTKQELINIVPKIPPEQASELFNDAVAKLNAYRRREVVESGKDPNKMEMQKIDQVWGCIQGFIDAKRATAEGDLTDKATAASGPVTMASILPEAIGGQYGVPTYVGLPADLQFSGDPGKGGPVQLETLSEVLGLAVRLTSRAPRAPGDKTYSQHVVQALQLALALTAKSEAEENFEGHSVSVSEQVTGVHMLPSERKHVCCSPWS